MILPPHLHQPVQLIMLLRIRSPSIHPLSRFAGYRLTSLCFFLGYEEGGALLGCEAEGAELVSTTGGSR